MSTHLDDRTFFVRHPQQRFRTRPPTEEEVADTLRLGFARPNLISVEQIVPGVRIRRYLRMAA